MVPWFELAFAARHAFDQQGLDASLTLVTADQGVLPGHAPNVAARVRRLLMRRGIALHQARVAGAKAGLMLANGKLLPADRIIAATGARPPCWLRVSRLALDRDGYIAVSAAHHSTSHPEVFAAGDVCGRVDLALSRSGVYAVRAGPVLAHNLLAALEGRDLHTYKPRPRSLYLLATGPRHAIASWGDWSAQGAWVWHWKNRIDRRFVRRNMVSGWRAIP